MNIKIIGAGLGGLASACLLANAGHEVHVYEKNEEPGGKINEIKADGFRFDTGPSLLTMPSVLKTLFEQCGASIDDYLSLELINPLCRYFYTDETVFNCYPDQIQTLKEVQRIAAGDVGAYQEFLEYAATLYGHTEEAFLFNPLYQWGDLRSFNLTDFLKIDAFKTVAQRVDATFSSTYMRQFFKRFTTYNGSSPFQAPATLNVIPHVELSLGGYYVKGGMYCLINALEKLTDELGVVIHYDVEVASINTHHQKVDSITTANNEILPADLVVSNSDAHETYLHLIGPKEVSPLKRRRLKAVEPSCSGLVLLLGINKKYDQLSHHNIFFSEDYEKEFDAIFNQKVMPDDPTIYIANTSFSDTDDAPDGGSNLFVLVNAPYLSDSWDWKKKQESYSHFIIRQLEKRGLDGLRNAIVYQHQITPVDFHERYRSNKGSIYGTSSNSKFAAFLRPKNKARNIKGLYLTGGSTHPGGGIPLVILSAFHAAELIRRYE